MRLYIVKWNKQGRRYLQGQMFDSRKQAITFLNSLILDYGIADARLITSKIQVFPFKLSTEVKK